jgi:hypothetical protein
MELSSRGLKINQYKGDLYTTSIVHLEEETDIIDCHIIQAIVKGHYHYWIDITKKIFE